MLAAADGNVSYRFSDQKIAITPTRRPKAFIASSELAFINIAGETISGSPSGEFKLHLEVYKKCPQAVAVVHAHPPTAIAWTIARPDLVELPSECLPEVILATGKIPIVPYARPGTEDMATALRPFLPEHKVMILARHGGLSWGGSLEEAYMGMERVEHSAEILKSACELGELTPLPGEEIEALRKMRESMGSVNL